MHRQFVSARRILAGAKETCQLGESHTTDGPRCSICQILTALPMVPQTDTRSGNAEISVLAKKPAVDAGVATLARRRRTDAVGTGSEDPGVLVTPVNQFHRLETLVLLPDEPAGDIPLRTQSYSVHDRRCWVHGYVLGVTWLVCGVEP